MVASNKTMARIAREVLPAQDERALNKFLTEYDWGEQQFTQERLEEFQKRGESRWSKDGYVILDDTITEKTGTKSSPSATSVSYHGLKTVASPGMDFQPRTCDRPRRGTERRFCESELLSSLSRTLDGRSPSRAAVASLDVTSRWTSFALSSREATRAARRHSLSKPFQSA